ncbi:DnaJ C-terminal domain-containing protein [Salinisphaera sp. T31B1]|uniref:DnaJ C-terminal domain-containing protein n=1 Tax=Salinisphaera sp. T31B1 TaxID=727963 RepID=UPI0033423B7C
MEYKNYYETLGVERSAGDDEIKRAYRKLARKYHPDVSKEADAEDRFKDVNEAYEVLRDPEKRAAYDQIPPGGYGRTEAGQRPGAGAGTGRGADSGFDFHGGGFTGADASDFSDFFESMFGRGYAGGGAAGGRGTAHVRGQDHTARIEVDLEDAFTGSTRTVSLRAPAIDEHGHVVERTRSLKVTVPKGVRAGQQLRLTGQGTPGIGDAPAGDLYLEIGFRTHPLYRLDGSDLIVDLPVAPWEAALGATVKTPTPAGPVDLKIPPNSNGGRRLRLKGRGMPGRTPGDLYAVLRIVLPPADSDAARKLYQDMADTMAFNPRAAMGV